jgi:hypothetical protein
LATFEPCAGFGDYFPILLSSMMEYAVFEAVGTDLRQLIAAPKWFDRLISLDEGSSQTPAERLPFLESFLPEASLFWEETQNGLIESDFWTQTDICREEIHLRAYALSMNGLRLLLVRSVEKLYKEHRRLQAFAHETAMQLKVSGQRQSQMQRAVADLAAVNEKLSEVLLHAHVSGMESRRFEARFEFSLRRFS